MRTGLLILVVALCLMNESKVESKDTKEGKKKKNPRDYTDADIYKLEEEWTVSFFEFELYYFDS